MIKTVNFGNVLSELEREDVSIVFLKNRGIFLGDDDGNLYRVMVDRGAMYLDNLIKNSQNVSFHIVPKETSKNIGEWEKEVWGVSEVRQFMKRQKLV